VILLYTQPATFTAPDGLNTANVGVSVFNLSDYVKVRHMYLTTYT
jgi:phosphatidylethanolamine-binding protein